MARFRNKKRIPFVKPIHKKQPTVDHVTGDKVPKSFVFCRGKLPGPLRQLQMDLRKLMLPFTALKLKISFNELRFCETVLSILEIEATGNSSVHESGNGYFIISGGNEKKRNNLKDFLNVAGPMGVTHFLILSKTESGPYLRIARAPQGPTLTFKIHEYSLASDVAQSQLRPRCPKDLFKNPPLIVLSGFGTGEQHLKLTTIMFQNIFPAIDINTVKLSSCQRIVLLNYNKDTNLIDFRQYSIRLQPVDVSRRIRKFVQNHQVPDLRSFQDVSDFVTRTGYGSESEVDDDAATVSLPADIGRINRASNKSAIKLQEVGPRMTLQLMKVEEGLCSGGVIFSESGNSERNNRGQTHEHLPPSEEKQD